MDETRDIPLPRTKECEGADLVYWPFHAEYCYGELHSVDNEIPTSALLAIAHDRLGQLDSTPHGVTTMLHIGNALRVLEQADG